MAKKAESSKVKYAQPHNIKLSGLNPALNQRQKERIHVKEKRKARFDLTNKIQEKYGPDLTKKQIKIIKRREEAILLALKGKLYCNSHNKPLCLMELLQQKCYMRHGENPPNCKYLFMETKKGIFVPFRLRGLAKELSGY